MNKFMVKNQIKPLYPNGRFNEQVRRVLAQAREDQDRNDRRWALQWSREQRTRNISVVFGLALCWIVLVGLVVAHG